MRSFTFIGLIGLMTAQSLFAQNWQIVNSDWHYHYVLHEANGEETWEYDAYTIRIDSQQQDQRFLHPIMALTDSGLYRNLPLFLQRRIQNRSDGSVWFSVPGSLVILPPPANAWLLDSAAGVSVNSVNMLARDVYGSIDSVRQLILSTGDTIEQSKAHGILRYPKGYIQNRYYRQIGIKGPDKGFQFPLYRDYFNYAIDDSIEFEIIDEEINGYYPYRLGYTDRTTTTERYIFLDSLHLPNGRVQYQVRQKSQEQYLRLEYDESKGEDTVANMSLPMLDSTFNMVFDFHPLISWKGQMLPDFENIYPHEAIEVYFDTIDVIFSPFSSIAKVYYNLNPVCGESIITRNISFEYVSTQPNLTSLEVDLLTPNYYPFRIWDGNMSWGVGLGYSRGEATRDVEQINLMPHNNRFYQTMEAFDLGGKQCGDFTPLPFGIKDTMPQDTTPQDTLFPPPIPVELPDSLFPYPNPAQDYFNIAADPDGLAIELAIFDLRGKQHLSQRLVGDIRHEVSLTEILPGSYLVRLSVPQRRDKVYWHRLLIVD
ncbi:MAG: hypothetical protein AAFN10_03390 [Bacteroidota bacterium]